MGAIDRRTRFGALLVLIGILSLFAGLLSPGALAHHQDGHEQGPPADPGNENGGGNPPGNNGTIKIDGFEFKEPSEPHDPNNEPHVDCLFNLEFSGFDNDPTYFGDYSFELQPPTTVEVNNVLLSGSVFIGEDGAGGGTDIDAVVPIDLGPALTASGAVPHDQQGFHVKVTVHADGSIGADTKFKVFWVEPCIPLPTVTPPVSTRQIALQVVKTNDANGDGTFTDSETASGPGAAVPFQAVVTNTGDVPLTITSLTDTFSGTTLDDVCPSLINVTLQPDESRTCTFTLPNYSPPAGGSLVNVVTVVGTQPNTQNTTTDNDDSTVQTPQSGPPPPPPPPPPPGPPSPPGQPPGPPEAPPGQPPGPPAETPPVVLPTVVESTPTPTPSTVPSVLPTRIQRPNKPDQSEEQPSVLPKRVTRTERFANLPTTGVDPTGLLALAGLFLASGGSLMAAGTRRRSN